MKSRIAFSLLFCLLLFLSGPQVSSQATSSSPSSFVRISLRNNSWKFRRFTIITYRPGENGNSTFSFLLAPGMWRNFWLPEGTRVYNASAKQVNTVMSGGALTTEPLLVVSENDRDRTVPLVP